jgi:hypothetical protein
MGCLIIYDSNVGVRQGCPGVFIEEIHDGIVAALPGVDCATVRSDADCNSPMGMFADDLNKFANIAQHSQAMLDVLHVFSEDNSMLLSLANKDIVICNSSFSCAVVIATSSSSFVDMHVLLRVQESKYLRNADAAR